MYHETMLSMTDIGTVGPAYGDQGNVASCLEDHLSMQVAFKTSFPVCNN